MRKLAPGLFSGQGCLEKLTNEIQVRLLGEPTNASVYFKG